MAIESVSLSAMWRKPPAKREASRGKVDFQSDFIRSGCLKTPHTERERAIHHDNASLDDPSGFLRSMARSGVRRARWLSKK
jgi:hypothetical protein